jgi:hypothetical protein
VSPDIVALIVFRAESAVQHFGAYMRLLEGVFDLTLALRF